MADTPVVLIHGPRQCGKSTLARQVVSTVRRGALFSVLTRNALPQCFLGQRVDTLTLRLGDDG
ncbi:AAA family ATPase [Acidithiobacillus sp.]|uniref:AAA family ATPase n=1 Tax=Acidithiobacillus sp. TaxID=1872118 RepID=UPI003458B5F0